MPYGTINDLPASGKDNLPEHAQEIYVKAFNNALNEYKNEETAYRVAWAAVKKVYQKDEKTGRWEAKRSKEPA